MQTAAYYATPLPKPPSSTDPLRASVIHLLARANSIPCTAAAQAFNQLVQPNNRFQISLDMLLPLLSGRAETPRRILASYILYFLYAGHPIVMNPFRTAFVEVFLRERDVARMEAERGGVSETEQLVWVLWKILKGDGNDLGPYSPVTLARSALPPKLRAAQLTIDDVLAQEDGAASDHLIASLNPSPVNTTSRGFSPIDSHTGTPISATARSPANDDAKSDLVGQGRRLLGAAYQRVLTLSEQRIVALSLPHFQAHTIISVELLQMLVSLNPSLGHPVVASFLKVKPDTNANARVRLDCINALRQLPPTLPTFDVIGRLLRDPTTVADNYLNGSVTIADIVRTDILGEFILNAIGWVEHAEKERREGLISDDRVPKTVQLLCRFYSSLIKLNIIDPASDADSAEMAHFALSHANLEDANALYRVLIMGKF